MMVRGRPYPAPSRACTGAPVKPKVIAAGAAAVVVLLLILAWGGRHVLVRVFPIRHEGRLARIAQFHKGGMGRADQGTRQINQFAMIFEDGFQCEGTDTSFAAVKEGDVVRIRGYHDVKGAPVLDPEWWECDEAQLEALIDVPVP